MLSFCVRHQTPNLPLVTSGILEPKSQKYSRVKENALYRAVEHKIYLIGRRWACCWAFREFRNYWITVWWRQSLDFRIWFSWGYNFSFQLVEDEFVSGMELLCHRILFLLIFLWVKKCLTVTC